MTGVVQDLVIVGRDAPVWLAACVMQSALGPAGLRVTVVELPDALGAADVYATLPRWNRCTPGCASRRRASFRQHAVLSRSANASTIRPDRRRVFHAYGSTGARIDNTEFLPNWIKARHYGLPVAFEDFCLTAAAARHGRMLVPDAEIERYGFTDYAYHLPAIPYAAWLRQLGAASRRRAARTTGVRVLMTPNGFDIGGVTSMTAGASWAIFFIDATGAKSLLLAGRLGVARESWRDSFHRGSHPCRTRSAGPVPAHLCRRTRRRERLARAASEPGLHACRPRILERTPTIAPSRTRNASRSSNCRASKFALTIRAAVSSPGSATALALARPPARSTRFMVSTCRPCSQGWFDLLPLFPVDADYAVERDEYNKNLQSAFDASAISSRLTTCSTVMAARSGSGRGLRPSAVTSCAGSGYSGRAAKSFITRMNPFQSMTGRH